MTFYVENETGEDFPFAIEETVDRVIRTALSCEHCPYDAEINLLITDAKGIRNYNREYRRIDRETDVLSFPGVDYRTPGDFSIAESDRNSYFNPETGELLLGDIILCKNRIFSQAEEYGHSILREFSFLIVHSILHLLGYDHMEQDEETVMRSHQDKIMEELNILR
ncbi:MAG: rRNA maturation RNase YbeY [Lachnospiraceae bacterium]